MSKAISMQRAARTCLSAALLLTLAAPSAQASSHREAPFITEQPKVDGTDLYMFRSYEPGRDGFVTIIADYLPLQDPYGGPNYFFLDPEATYDIHVDNDGDAKDDLVFSFQFQNSLRGGTGQELMVGGKSVAIPLVNFGPLAPQTIDNLNLIETYSATIARPSAKRKDSKPRDISVGGSTVFMKPKDNIGTNSIPDYAAYAAQYVYSDVTIPGCGAGAKMFVGQRKDPFVVNLGEVFDLINLNPLGAPDAEKDDLADKNITSLILEVPISCLTNGTEPVIGAWTTASIPKRAEFGAKTSFEKPVQRESRALSQVSRLGSPLVNEVVIGLRDKDKFNSSEPRDDGQFALYVTNPTLPALIQTLFPAALAPTLFPRTDLVAAFLTGINTTATGNLNQPANVVPAEMLRLNTTIPPTAQAMQNNLGVIGGDNAGFPNGRRPGDDVVDIALRVVMGKLITLGLYGTPDQAPAGGLAFTDGATLSATDYTATFPYINTPLPGAPN